MSANISDFKTVCKPSRNLSLSSGTISGLVACIDSLILFYTGFIIYLLYPGWSIENYSIYLSAAAINALATVELFYFANLYSVNSIIDPRKEFSKIILLCTIVFLVLITLAFGLKISAWFSRNWVFCWFISAVYGIYLGRLLIHRLLLIWARTKRLTWNIAIVGGGEQGSLLIESLKEHGHPWIHIIGIFDDRSCRLSPTIDRSLVSGSVDALVAKARINRIDDILVALPWEAEERLFEILNKLQVLPVNVRLSPDIFGFNFLNYRYSHYIGIPVLNIFDKPLSGWNYVLKAIEDKVLSALILIFILPVLAIIAILIKLDSPGPVFFRQKRYGLNNQLIEVLKFRTMYINQQDDNAEQLTTRDDPRVTRIGRFLRRTSLDELPQFFNVLTGGMSIVGPRPHATEAKAAGMLYEKIVAQYAVRHKVKPGITGWAQINGWRGETDTEEKIRKRVEYDIDYINNWSLICDLKIIVKTVWVTLIGRNAY